MQSSSVKNFMALPQVKKRDVSWISVCVCVYVCVYVCCVNRLHVKAWSIWRSPIFAMDPDSRWFESQLFAFLCVPW